MVLLRRSLGVLLASVLGAAGAKSTPEDAAALGPTLTPTGAEIAANSDGSIPPWSGGLTAPPSCYKAGGRYCDPFPDDQPLYVITRDNLVQHSGKLSPGQVELFRRNADYQMRVYPTRRSFANPEAIYNASRDNVKAAELTEDGDGIAGTNMGVPFPMPTLGAEIVWNHKLRYQGAERQRWNNQFSVNADGEYSRTRFLDEARYVYNNPGLAPKKGALLLGQFFMAALEPPRLVGSAYLLHETVNPGVLGRKAWQSLPGTRKLKKLPHLGYDTPGVGADGLRTNDQLDMFNGGMDRYTWKYVTKKEMVVPANSYRLHSGDVEYADILQPGHLNQELVRYELRRVWQVDAVLARNSIHIYRKRTFYVDEDGWQIRVADLYDSAGELWRLQEAHSVIAYDLPYELPVCETVYDLRSGRYLAQALNNEEEAETAAQQFEESYFEPSRSQRRIAR